MVAQLSVKADDLEYPPQQVLVLAAVVLACLGTSLHGVSDVPVASASPGNWLELSAFPLPTRSESALLQDPG